jgi:acetyl esterase/lipase
MMKSCIYLLIFLSGWVAWVAPVPAVAAEPEEFLTDPACKRVFRDVTCLPKERSEKMDVYLPAGGSAGARSCFLYIHGGGWTTGDKYQHLFFKKLCVPLLENGFVVASVNYNMTERPLWPRNLYDCKTAVRFLKAHAGDYEIDPTLIVVSGTSAGGHLALMTALTCSAPELDPDPAHSINVTVAGGVDFCGITDVRRIMPQHQPKRWGNILFNGGPDAVPDDGSEPDFSKAWKTASPIFQIRADSVPLLLVHGLADNIVEPDHAEQLQDRARAVGSDCTFFPVENTGHGIQLCTPEAMERVAEFVRSLSKQTCGF